MLIVSRNNCFYRRKQELDNPKQQPDYLEIRSQNPDLVLQTRTYEPKKLSNPTAGHESQSERSQGDPLEATFKED